MHGGVAAITGSDQTLLDHGDLCLGLWHDTLEVLHHNTERGGCLLHRLPEISLFLAGRDYSRYPLDHRFTVEQNQSAACDQQEHGNKANDCESHNSPLNIHIDDFPDNQST